MPARSVELKVMIRCEEFEGELTSIREDVIDSLEDGWVVKSVGKINVHHHLHLKDDQSFIFIFSFA